MLVDGVMNTCPEILCMHLKIALPKTKMAGSGVVRVDFNNMSLKLSGSQGCQ